MKKEENAKLREMNKYEEEVQKAWDRLSPDSIPEDWNNTLFTWYDAEWKAYEESLYSHVPCEEDTEMKKKMESSANLVKFALDAVVILICVLIVMQTIENYNIVGTTVAISGTVVLILCNHIVTARINRSEYLRYVAECKVKSQILRQRQASKGLRLI